MELQQFLVGVEQDEEELAAGADKRLASRPRGDEAAEGDVTGDDKRVVEPAVIIEQYKKLQDSVEELRLLESEAAA